MVGASAGAASGPVGVVMLTDRQRVELALPARLLFNAAVSAAKDGDCPEATIIVDDLKIACNEPVDGMLEPERRKVCRRIERAAEELAKPFAGKCTAGKMAMVVYYFTEDLIQRGVLELYEGSPMANASSQFLSVLGQYFEVEDMDRSARKQAAKVLERCQALGYYSRAA